MKTFIKFFTKLYVQLIVLIVLTILEFGFIGPALVSTQSNLGVSLGFASVILVIFFWTILAFRLAKSVINWVEELD